MSKFEIEEPIFAEDFHEPERFIAVKMQCLECSCFFSCKF